MERARAARCVGTGDHVPDRRASRDAHGLSALQRQAGNRAVAGRIAGVQRLGDEHGQHVGNGVVGLTASLSSPVPANALVRYEAEPLPVPGFTGFRFTVTDRSSGTVVRLLNSASPVVDLRLPGVARYRITCAVTHGRTELTRVSLDQDTRARVRVSGSGGQDTAALDELANELSQYVLDAATATGPNGITARFLASVLRIEIGNTAPLPLMSPTAARDREVARSQAAVRRREAGEDVPAGELDASIGVGQVKPSTAAMLLGDTPPIEQDRANRAPGRDRIQRGFMALAPARQRTLVTLLSWPKSNIAIAAQLLAGLKNRVHRYPGLPRAVFGASERAAQIIATEYNLGGSRTPEALANPSWYGREAWQHMGDPEMARLFPNT
ncbi:hypothetical protein AB0I60_01375 [Actinosynnema sp. NPDC050436]|uniref:hypothetical protein n=1 Tax=Actinosynnema sp. NPDC050436 TaxID=3155659 RepID=UPI0033C57446